MKPLTITGILCLAMLSVNAQSTMEEPDKWYGMLNISEGYRYQDESEWSRPGLNYELYYRIHPKVGAQFKTGFLWWKESDMDSYFAMIGLHVKLMSLGKFDALAFGNAGTSAVLGNDYAGFFGIAESGIRIIPVKHKCINVALSWNQNLVFHPSSFSYINLSAGYVF